MTHEEKQKRLYVNYGIMVALVNALDDQINTMNLEFKRDSKILHSNLKGASDVFVKHLNRTLEPSVKPIIEAATDMIQDAVFDIQKSNQ